MPKDLRDLYKEAELRAAQGFRSVVDFLTTVSRDISCRSAMPLAQILSMSASSEHYLLQLHQLLASTWESENNADRLKDFRLFEKVPFDEILRWETVRLVLGLLRVGKTNELKELIMAAPDFTEGNRWNGNRLLPLFIRSVVVVWMEECARGESGGSKSFLEAIRNLFYDISQDQIAFLWIVLAYVVMKESNGVVERWQASANDRRGLALIDMFGVAKEGLAACDVRDASIVNFLFEIEDGKSCEMDDLFQLVGAARADTNFDLQRFLIVRMLELPIDDDEMLCMVKSAFAGGDCSVWWRDRGFSIAALYFADAIAKARDPMRMWETICQMMVQPIDRFRTDRDSDIVYPLSRCIDMYLELVVCLLNCVITAKDWQMARCVFERGWNDCITVLYSAFLPAVAAKVVRYLFVYKVNLLSKEFQQWDNVKLLDQLPIIQEGRAQDVDLQIECVRSLALNALNVEEIQQNDPKLFQFIDDLPK